MLDEENNFDHLTELKPKIKAFCQEFIIDLNGSQAAIRAGYSKENANVTGSRLLAKDNVQQEIQRLLDMRSKRTMITAEYVLTTIAETVERCAQRVPVLDKKGRQVYVTGPKGEAQAIHTFDSKGVLKGTELLAKHLKLITDKVDLNVKDDRIDLSKVPEGDDADEKARRLWEAMNGRNSPVSKD